MSWHLTLTCMDHELDGKLKALIEKLPARQDNPASNRALLRIQDHLLEQLRHAPFKSEFTVETSGHYDVDGSGSHSVSVTIVSADRLEARRRLAVSTPTPSVTSAPPPPVETVDLTPSDTPPAE